MLTTTAAGDAYTFAQFDGQNTEYHHGARAYFVGTYFKVATLDEPIDLESEGD